MSSNGAKVGGGQQFDRNALREFAVLEAFLIAAAAKSYDLVYVMGRDVVAPYVAVIIVFAVKGADGVLRLHKASIRSCEWRFRKGDVNGRSNHRTNLQFWLRLRVKCDKTGG
jgi:hypothetical protein